ncbi:PAS domain-containing protein [Candidatus Regiella insecticola]|nr:PAS domain-containing protein [Candidatus Regiella insecticola]GFN45557.1 similar to transcription regulator LuxR family [Candidatus Regiella insecticola]
MIKSNQKNIVGRFDNLPAGVSSQFILMCEHSTDPWGIKNRRSQYVYVNQAFRDFLNLTNKFDITGKSDSEIKHSTAEFASHFQEHDLRVIKTEKKVSSLDTYHYGRKNIIQSYLCDKYPLYDDNKKCMGIIFHATRSRFFSITPLERDCPISLVTDPPEGLFTEQEQEILFFVLQYSSYEKAAEKLELADTEVEHAMLEIYKKAAKYEKVSINSLEELRRFCQIKGFAESIPARFMQIGSRFIDDEEEGD